MQLSFISLYAQDDITLQLNLHVSQNKIKELKAKQSFGINELQYIFADNLNKWIEQGDKLGITCQAVAPMGQWIGNFNNPDFKGESIAGGQGESCNLWLIPKDKEQKSEQSQPGQPNDKPYKYQEPNTPRYFAI
jgi:hypothetical protein